MSRKLMSICLVTGLAFLATWAAAADEALKATTMRIQQQMNLEGMKVEAKYDAAFAPPGRFRVDGAIQIEDMTLKSLVVGEGDLVKQLTQTPMGPMGTVVDLARVRKALPELDYAPSKTYDPSVYKQMLAEIEEKKELPEETLDGVVCKGWEFKLDKGRLSMPSNVSIGLPDPAAMRVWLPEDGIARRVELLDAKGTTFLNMTYTDVKRDVEVPKSKFEMQWPAGTTPMDITDMILGMVAGQMAPPAAEQPAQPVEPAQPAQPAQPAE